MVRVRWKLLIIDEQTANVHAFMKNLKVKYKTMHKICKNMKNKKWNAWCNILWITFKDKLLCYILSLKFYIL